VLTEEQKKELDIILKIPQLNHPERVFVENRITSFNEVIYDLGCGRHKTIDRAIGIDIRRGRGEIRASIDSLPMIKSGTVDVIISRHSLEHLIDPVKTLREWIRILKLNGRMIIILPDHEFVDTIDFMIGSGVHLHAYTRESFANLADTLGLFIVEISTVIEGWSFGIVLEKRGES
jgi:SAM-dependent methyltransferase